MKKDLLTRNLKGLNYFSNHEQQGASRGGNQYRVEPPISLETNREDGQGSILSASLFRIEQSLQQVLLLFEES